MGIEKDEEYELQELEDSLGSSVQSRLALFRRNWRSQETGLVFPHFWNKVIIPKESRKYQIWVNVILAWAIYSSFFTPFEFGFFRGLPKNLWWIDQAGQIIFMVDIVVNFFVAYKDRQTYKWVVDHHSIALRYAKSDLIPDALACLPWDVIYKGTGERELVRCLLWVRLYRVRKVTSFFHRLEQDIRINYLFTRIVKLLTVEIYCTHSAACIFYYLATTLPPTQEKLTWIGSLTLGGYHFDDFRHISLGRRYVVSLYFAIVTMATVGYGDIHAVNTREMLFVMIFVSFDMILGAYLIGNMTALIVKGSSTEKFRDKMTALIKYMNRNRLGREIRSQLKSHLQLQYKSQFIEDGVVQDLPLSICAKVAQSLYLSTLERVLLFENCSTEFTSQVATRLHEEHFLPGEVIMEQGSAADQIYIVAHGSLDEVVINLDGSEEIITNLEAESIFGEVAVLCSIPQPYTIRVRELCKVLRIDKQTFFNIMRIYFADGRQVLDNLLKIKSENKLRQLETDISFLIAEKEVELSLKVNNAAYHGKSSYLKTLIKSGADPNKADYDGRTPLHLAAAKGHEGIVLFLVQEGANINIEDTFGNTPLIEAVKGCHNDVIKILRTAGASLTEKNAGDHLRKAVLGGNLDLVKSLLENGIDPNCSDHNSRTALHIAASEGLTLMAKVLIKHGADIYAKDRWGKTPIHESTQFGARIFNNLFKDATMEKEGYAIDHMAASNARNLKGDESLHEIEFNTSSDEDKGKVSRYGDDLGDRYRQMHGLHGKAELEVKRRCTVFACLPWIPLEERKHGVVVWVPDTIDSLLCMASQHFGHTYNHVLNEDVGEILNTDIIRDSDKVYVIDDS